MRNGGVCCFGNVWASLYKLMGKVAANKAEGVKTSQRSSEKGKRRLNCTPKVGHIPSNSQGAVFL